MRRNQARVKNADVRHPSSIVVMHRRKSASPIHNVLKLTTNKSEFHKNTERTTQLINYVMDKATAELGPDSCQTHPERLYASGSYRNTLTAISPGIT